jgi:hypothetical protein
MIDHTLRPYCSVLWLVSDTLPILDSLVNLYIVVS